MSLIDFEKLTPRDFIAQFILGQRGSGIFLPYNDYQIIDQWLRLAQNDSELLLLVLSELLPAYLEKRSSATLVNLKGLNHKVMKAIASVRDRQIGI